MSKYVYTGVNRETAIKKAVILLKDTVVSTFGPDGKVVIIEVPGSHVPIVTKDGVTVSEHLHSDIIQVELILSLIKESARRTAIEQGDGTTTSTLLAISLVEFLSKRTVTKDVIDGMLHAINFVYQYLEDVRIDCKFNETALLSVINISCNGDDEIVRLLTGVVKEVGADGIINVVSTEENKTSVTYNDGATMTSVAFPGHGKGGIWERENVDTLIIEGKLEFAHQLKTTLTKITTQPKDRQRPLIIIAQEFSEEVQRTIAVNNKRGMTDISLVDAEGFGNKRLEILEDLQLLTGGEILSTNGATSYRLLDFDLIQLGNVSRAIVTARETTVYPGTKVDVMCRQIREDELRDSHRQLKANPATVEAGALANLERQLSKFVKVATVKVGGFTEAETKERKDRVDDAVCAVVSAHNGGVLPGGGASLYRASLALAKAIAANSIPYSGGHKTGVDAIIDMCGEPIELLASNANISLEPYLRSLSEDNMVINFSKEESGDALALGIIDPYNVTISALHNALSVAKTISRSSAIISAQIPEQR